MLEQQRRKLIAACILSVIGTALGLVPFIIIYLMVLELFNPVIDQAYVWKLVFWCIVSIVLRFGFMGLSGSLLAEKTKTTPKPTPTPEEPGFEAIFAIAAMTLFLFTKHFLSFPKKEPVLRKKIKRR